MPDQFSIDDVKALQAWADKLYLGLMHCLDHYGHADDCYLFRCPDDPDIRWNIGCDCWRSQLKKIASQFMVTPKNTDTNPNMDTQNSTDK